MPFSGRPFLDFLDSLDFLRLLEWYGSFNRLEC